MRLALGLAAVASLCFPVLAQREGLPPEIVRDCLALDRLPTGRYVPVDAWEAEGTRAGHNAGALLVDPEASGGQAWALTPGEGQPGTVVFGPYLEGLPEGEYVAFVRVKAPGPLSEEPYGTLDACVAYGQELLGAWELMGSDLRPDAYVEAPLGFRYLGGKLECRFTWNGYQPIALDRFTLLRLEGGSLGAGRWRVPEAVASGEPSGLAEPTATRPFPDVLPRSAPPAKHLFVFDARPLPPDRRMAAYVLQGLANREQPRLYCLTQQYDEQWLAHMRARGWVESTETIADFAALLERFGGVVNGAVITDPALPASKNVATMLASVEDALVVSPRLQEELKLPVVADLRGRWKTSVEATRWAFETLWPRLNHFVIACSYPEHLALRDYLVQHRVFLFWLSGPLDGARPYADPDAEIRLMEELLARMPVNMPVLSYPWAGKDVGIGEGPGVTLFAEFGKYLVGSIDTPNLSVHSGIEVPLLRQKPAPPAPPLDPSKTYYSFIISDGDNLPVLTTSNFPQLWADPTRGSLPLGWTLSPAASVVLPDLVDYYYATATPRDDFVAAVSGIGYTYPDSYAKRYRDPDRGRIYDGFLAQTAEYMARCDLTSAWIMNATRPEVIARYAEQIPGLEALFPDYGKRVLSPEDATYPTVGSVPVFHAATTLNQEENREERIVRMVNDLRTMTTARKPAFLHAFVLNWFADLPMLEEVARRLGPDFVCVRPDHLAALYRQDLAQRRLLVRLPATAAAIEGLPLRIEGTLRNCTGEAAVTEIRAREGLVDARVQPERADTPPGRPTGFSVTGKPVGERVVVAFEGGLGNTEVTTALRRIGRDEIVGALPGIETLVPAAALEAEALAHRDGSQWADGDASNGLAWLAERGEARPTWVLFGPYAPLEKGRYLVLFRLQRTSPGTGALATLDVGPSGGQAPMTERRVACEDLTEGEWRYVALVMDHAGGAYETRVQWTGAASLAIDSVLLWRLEE